MDTSHDSNQGTKGMPTNMTKRILVATALVIALLLTTLALTSGTQVAQGAATSPACIDCKSDCDTSATYCRDRANQEMTACRNAGYSFDYCKTVGNKHYSDCMDWRGCGTCIDGRYGLIYYCRCGKPWASTGGGGGTNIDPYKYSDPSDPSNDDDFSWYCELEPCACGADLPWCG